MTFRDDHDATLARAEALERELEKTREERDRLRERVEELERRPAPPPPPRPRPNITVRIGVSVFAALLFGVGIAVLIATRRPHAPVPHEPGAAQCTLRTSPSAEIILVTTRIDPATGEPRDDEELLGATPITRDAKAWLMDEASGGRIHYEARRAGYEMRYVSAPMERGECLDYTFELVPTP